MPELIYRRILLKLSGEALMGEDNFGIDPGVITRVAGEIRDIVQAGAQVALVIGGGNIFRGAGLAQGGIDRVTADHMGMLATVMNGLAMKDALQKAGLKARVMSALAIDQICDPFLRDQAVQSLEQGEIVIFSAGTGSPLFTTDTAASLRAIEIGAQLLIKATKVDGIYSSDPVTNPDAEFYPRLSYDRALREGLKVMDATAIMLCRDHQMPLQVMNINNKGAMMRLMLGEEVGSLVENGE